MEAGKLLVMPRIELVTLIAAAPPSVFDSSLSVDAHRESMGSNERAVAGVMTGSLGLNDSVTWKARHFGFPFRLTSTVTAWDRPTRFVDEQTRGPFASWWHEHRFEPMADGGTRMLDTIIFRSPLGPIGRVVDAVILEAYMRRLIERRNEWLQKAF